MLSRKEEIELGMKCCNEFLCGECPYKKFDDKKSGYTLRCIHKLMGDINKLYFKDEIEMLFRRLDEIDGELQDWHISAYKSDLLTKERDEIKNELRKRYEIRQ